MVPPTSHKVPRVSWYFGSRLLNIHFAYGAFTLSGWLSQNHSAMKSSHVMRSLTPDCTQSGLGSFPFARRYSGNRVFFLFLRLLRCFSSPGSLPYVMDWRMDNWRFSSWVSPFRNLRITGYLLLPEAFRSLSRLSSALSAKASTLRSSSLNLHIQHSVAGVRPGFFTSSWAPSSRMLPTTSCDHLSMISSDVLNILRIVVFCMRFSRYMFFSD